MPKTAPKNCKYCKPDHKHYGPGWIYMGNNGLIVSCPVCNDDGQLPRER